MRRPGLPLLPGPVASSGALILAAVMCLAVAAGCGKGGAGTDRSAGAAAAPAPVPTEGRGAHAEPRFRWLVRTQGPPPSIAVENRARGTTAWRLPGPRDLLGGEARGAVEGYVAEQAIAAGQTQTVYVNAPGARTVTVQVYRMGWYGGTGGRLVLQSARLPAIAQRPCTHRDLTGLTECDWRLTLSFGIPQALPSGVFIARLHASDGAQSDCLFVVRSLRATGLLVEIPTASYEAYNSWGGDSLYPGGSRRVTITHSTQGVEVSYDRPYATQTGAGQFFDREVAMVRFLERYAYPVSYTTIESIDGDPAQVDRAHVLMDIGHSEYWSARDERAFARARDEGRSLIFISSDTMAWRVRFARASAASSQAGQPDHVIVAYKESAGRDPDRSEPSGLFPLGGAALVGSAYNGCITPRVRRSGPPTYRYYPWTPAPRLQPSWLFAHAGVSARTRIPGVVGYELDQRTPATPAGTLLVGTSTGVTCLGEDEPSPVHGTVAQTTLYQARSGALVFATGTLGWEYALSPVPQASPDAPASPDPRVVAMTRNLLARVLGKSR